MAEGLFNYLAPMDERPYYYVGSPPEGRPWRNTRGDRRRLPVADARQATEASLDREGFALARLVSAADPWDPRDVRGRYLPEVEALVREATGAARVVAFDHNVRSEARADGAQAPVRFVHNDYTLGSGPQRVRDLMPADEVDELLARRFAVINVWKPIARPVQRAPLGFLDARSLVQEDFVATDLRYPERTGEVYSLLWREAHRWAHYPEMQPDEALLLKCYDSAADRARFTAHSAFDDPATPEHAPARESIEVRTLAFF